MIKAIYKRPDQPDLVILGLSDENLRRLREDMPILVNGEALGLDVDIAVIAGRTEDTIQEQMRQAGML